MPPLPQIQPIKTVKQATPRSPEFNPWRLLHPKRPMVLRMISSWEASCSQAKSWDPSCSFRRCNGHSTKTASRREMPCGQVVWRRSSQRLRKKHATKQNQTNKTKQTTKQMNTQTHKQKRNTNTSTREKKKRNKNKHKQASNTHVHKHKHNRKDKQNTHTHKN